MNKPETLGDLVLSMKPTFYGPIAGGLWGCLYTWVEPGTEEFQWAFGFAPDADSARGEALRRVAEQRHGWEIASLIVERL